MHGTARHLSATSSSSDHIELCICAPLAKQVGKGEKAATIMPGRSGRPKKIIYRIVKAVRVRRLPHRGKAEDVFAMVDGHHMPYVHVNNTHHPPQLRHQYSGHVYGLITCYNHDIDEIRMQA